MNGGSGLKVGDNSVIVPTLAGVQYLIAPASAPAHPIGMYTNPRRRTGATEAAALEKDGIMASSKGNAMATPAPRRNVRRGKALLVIIIVISSSEMVCC